jgi:transposase
MFHCHILVILSSLSEYNSRNKGYQKDKARRNPWKGPAPDSIVNCLLHLPLGWILDVWNNVSTVENMSVTRIYECGKDMWVWQVYVIVTRIYECGKDMWVWLGYVIVTRIYECGKDMWVWLGYMSVTRICECDKDMWVWQVYVIVTRIYECGKDMWVWLGYMSVARICDCDKDMWVWQGYECDKDAATLSTKPEKITGRQNRTRLARRRELDNRSW